MIFEIEFFMENYRKLSQNHHQILLFTSRKHAYIILTPLNPTFYIVKLGFIGVYIIFLISA